MKATSFSSWTRLATVLTALGLILNGLLATAQKNDKMEKKILFVVTSHNQKGNTGEPTGFYLSEVTHPWDVLIASGYVIDFVSPEGGAAPVDGFNLGDPVNKKFWSNAAYRNKIAHTMKPSEVHAEDYAAIHFAGGHGAMWDFPGNTDLAAIAARIYERGGIVSAVCHGPAGLVNIRLSDGSYLVNGKKINAFTNEEEAAVKLDKVVPFLLETKLKERGAIFEKSGLWQSHVVADNRVITGQNPQSAKAVGEAIAAQLQYSKAVAVLTRYDIKQGHQEQVRKALNQYVDRSLSKEDNIMAEAYSEQENPLIMWVIERWSSKNAFRKASASLASVTEDVLSRPVQTTYIRDLEPISEKEWRKAAADGDKPLIIMLFVDARPGTESDFKTVYHTAMPQFRSEPGVINYQLSQLETDRTQFVTYEKFRNEEAFQYHLNFPPIQPVIDYLNTSIKAQPFQRGLHRLVPLSKD